MNPKTYTGREWMEHSQSQAARQESHVATWSHQRYSGQFTQYRNRALGSVTLEWGSISSTSRLWGMYKRSEPIKSLHSVQNHMANVYSSEVCLQTKNFPKISKFFFSKNTPKYDKLSKISNISIKTILELQTKFGNFGNFGNFGHISDRLWTIHNTCSNLIGSEPLNILPTARSSPTPLYIFGHIQDSLKHLKGWEEMGSVDKWDVFWILKLLTDRSMVLDSDPGLSNQILLGLKRGTKFLNLSNEYMSWKCILCQAYELLILHTC